MVVPVTVVIANFIDSPTRLRRFAAALVIRLQVAALSKRQFTKSSLDGIVCTKSKTFSRETALLELDVDITLAIKGDEPPCNDLW